MTANKPHDPTEGESDVLRYVNREEHDRYCVNGGCPGFAFHRVMKAPPRSGGPMTVDKPHDPHLVVWRQWPVTGTAGSVVTWAQTPTSDDPWWRSIQEANRDRR